MKIEFGGKQEVPLYTEENGRGFVEEAGTIPKRKLDVKRLRAEETGIFITENKDTMSQRNDNDYNYGGLVYRVNLPHAGAYRIEVVTTVSPKMQTVSLSGMQEKSVGVNSSYSAIGKEPAMWQWSYEFVCGDQALDIEIEPAPEMVREILMEAGKSDGEEMADAADKAGKAEPAEDEMHPSEKKEITVGISELSISELPVRDCGEGEKPTLFILGDSTAKTYNFEEAPMSSWGQLFYEFFDPDKIDVVNYSQGGRSLKTMYMEGRLNTILLRAKPGDYLFLQSGHNDESREELKGITCRFGRGNTAESFEMFLTTYFLPAIRARGVKPVFVTCMTRMEHDFYTVDRDFDQEPVNVGGFLNSPQPHVDFPGIMKAVGEREGVPVVDMHSSSVAFLQTLGGNGAKAMFLGIEPGESPGKTNSGSYANGNPGGFCDCCHYKECLAKEFVRLVITETVEKQILPREYFTRKVLAAVAEHDFSKIFPEQAPDIKHGANAYYRNAIEKMLQAGVMEVRRDGLFYPKDKITVGEFAECLEKAWKIVLDDKWKTEECFAEILVIWRMLPMLLEAYHKKFTAKPKYMTDYNGVALSPDDPNYDSNLVGESAQYYPLVPWDRLVDKEECPAQVRDAAREVYELGLFRSEYGIHRGLMRNGDRLEFFREVTRDKAAKYLYFLWVLQMPIKCPGHLITGLL